MSEQNRRSGDGWEHNEKYVLEAVSSTRSSADASLKMCGEIKEILVEFKAKTGGEIEHLDQKFTAVQAQNEARFSAMETRMNVTRNWFLTIGATIVGGGILWLVTHMPGVAQ